MNKLRYKFMMFMQGRYGIDEFYNFLLIFYLALFLINCFLQSSLLSSISLLLMIYTFYRVFSKNIGARQKENAKYLVVKRRLAASLGTLKKIYADKAHVYKKCPHCKATLRFPRKKGVHDASCPKCHGKLKVRVWF